MDSTTGAGSESEEREREAHKGEEEGFRFKFHGRREIMKSNVFSTNGRRSEFWAAMTAPPAAVQATPAAMAAVVGENEGRREEEDEGVLGFPGGGNDEKGKRRETITATLSVV